MLAEPTDVSEKLLWKTSIKGSDVNRLAQGVFSNIICNLINNLINLINQELH